MEEIKYFFDIFKRYEPSSSDKRMLLQKGGKVKVYQQKDPFCVKVHIDFDEPINFRTLWAIEEECRVFYNAVAFRIFPHFPAALFSAEAMPDVVDEAVREGAATHGFFDHARYREEGESVVVEIPFLENGVGIVQNTGTEKILEEIIFNQYGVRRKVVVKQSHDAEERIAKRQEEKRKLEEELDRQAIESMRRAQMAMKDGGMPVPTDSKLPRVSGLTDAVNCFEVIDSTTFAPMDEITKENLMVILYRYAQYNQKNSYSCNAPTAEAERYMLERLQKQVVIADWQYRAKEAPVETASVFRNAGFDSLLCPWDRGVPQLTAVMETVKTQSLRGFMHTTWHTLTQGMPYVTLAAVLGAEDAEKRSFTWASTSTAALLRRVKPCGGDYERAGWSRVQVSSLW